MKRSLYHWPLDPGSREVRLALAEKRLTFTPLMLDLPADTEKLSQLNPSGRPPVLIEQQPGSKCTICESRAILEYLEETRPAVPLLPKSHEQRAEVRRLMSWFSDKFQSEVLGFLLFERLEKPLLGLGSPDAAAMREGKRYLLWHLAVMEELTQSRNWLAGEDFSLADISAAAALSCLDYFGDVPFEQFVSVKSWYVRIKSRPSFRPLLADHFPGIAPAPDYANLDF